VTRRRRTGLLAAALLALLLLLAGGAAGVAWWWRWANAPAAGSGAPSVRVTVPPGASARVIGEDLERRGVIRSARAWSFRVRRAVKPSKGIQPGVYDVSPSELPARLLRRLVEGDIAKTKVTFPEGFTLQQMARRLQERGVIRDGQRFLELTSRRGNTLRASFRPPPKLEGFLFPDTYTFPVASDEAAVAQQMLGNFDRLVARGKAGAMRSSRYALHDLVTIASLVEREARVPPDRAKIAGVIYNRLDKKMPLQIDATVQYARGQHAARLLFKDLKVDSPYNTYRRRGLPPGPICNPGMESLKAALNPERHEYLYYVAKPDGSHLFARTFAEHQHNIRLVRQQGNS